MRRKVDRLIGRCVKFAAEFGGDQAKVAAEPPAVEVADRQIDIARVAIEMIGMDRRPSWQHEQFGRAGIHAGVFVESDKAKPEFSPRWDAEDAGGLIA